MSLLDVKLIELPKILDDRGNLSFFQNNDQIPFAIKRVYWIYDVPGGEQRGGHAYKQLQEVVIALSGSFDVVLSDGRDQKRFTLNRSYYGLYVPRMIWRDVENFSTNSLAFIATDASYSADQYIRDFEQFKVLANEQ
jgi:dTDP-4-dehydrorhamnose 3,5-epimerase-like enzyme